MIFDDVIGARVRDLSVLGFVDPADEVPRFAPFYDRVYLTLSTGILAVDATAQNGKMIVAFVDDMVVPFELDEGMVAVRFSLAQLVLGELDPAPVISAVETWGKQVGGANTTHKAVRLCLDSERAIGLDAGYHWGIRVASEARPEEWRERLGEPDPALTPAVGGSD